MKYDNRQLTFVVPVTLPTILILFIASATGGAPAMTSPDVGSPTATTVPPGLNTW